MCIRDRSVWRIATMGIVMIPDMGSNQLSITVDVADDTAKDDAFATADAVMDAVSALDGVQTVGAMSGGNSMVSMMGSDAAVDNTTFTLSLIHIWWFRAQLCLPGPAEFGNPP